MAQEKGDVYGLLKAWAYQGETWARFIDNSSLAGKFAILVGLADRSTTNTVRITVAGKFSAGKTTFINNMVGKSVLPVGLDETTAIPTIVRYGEKDRLLLRRGTSWYEPDEKSKQEFLKLTKENIGPFLREYLKEHDEVIFEMNHDSLKGVEILDTPGLSSRDQDDKSLQVLRNAEALIYVCNVTAGGLAADEIEYLKIVPQNTPKMILLTHVDLVPPKNIKEVKNFVKTTLENEDIEITGIVEMEKDRIKQPLSFHHLIKDVELSSAVESLVKDIMSELSQISQEDQPDSPFSGRELLALGAKLLGTEHDPVLVSFSDLLQNASSVELYLSASTLCNGVVISERGSYSVFVDGVQIGSGFARLKAFHMLKNPDRYVLLASDSQANDTLITEGQSWLFDGEVNLVISRNKNAWAALGRLHNNEKSKNKQEG